MNMSEDNKPTDDINSKIAAATPYAGEDADDDEPEAPPAQRAAGTADSKDPKDPPISKGRIVMFHANVHDQIQDHPALVVKVWSNECVNLKVTDESGHDYVVTSVCKATTYGQAQYWSYPKRV